MAFYDSGHHTITTTVLPEMRKRAVVLDHLTIAQEELEPRMRSRSDARRRAQEFAEQTFLVKVGSQHNRPGWELFDEFVLTIPEDERYF